MNPLVLALIPVFKDNAGEIVKSLGDVFCSYARGVENYMTSWGRAIESVASGLGDRLRGGPRP